MTGSPGPTEREASSVWWWILMCGVVIYTLVSFQSILVVIQVMCLKVISSEGGIITEGAM